MSGQSSSTSSGDGYVWLLGALVVLGAAAKLRAAVPPWLFAGAITSAVVLLAGAVVLLGGRRTTPGDPLPSMATRRDVAALAPAGAATSARRLRVLPTGAGPDDLGVILGHLEPRGPELRASWEDTLLTVMAPRSGKTTRVAARAVLGAPGGVVATSNKADLLCATSRARGRRSSVFVFDPQRIAHAPQAFTWNPLAAVVDVESAGRLAEHFLPPPAQRDPFWDKASGELLEALFLAAGCSGQTLAAVYLWLADSTDRQPVRALVDAGHDSTAASLRAMQAGAAETVAGVFQSARTAAQCLRDPAIMRWVTPAAGLPALDVADVVNGAALYLLSKDSAGGASPLVAALTDAVFRAGVHQAERLGGRLDPPLVCVLDEAANICRIADLPDLYSHLGSRGIVPLTILQSYKQGERVWGAPGVAALWSASTVKLVGAGADDADFAEDVSRLVGDHDVPQTSTSRRHDGITQTDSTHRRRILDAAAIRALPRGRALLLATGCKPAQIRLSSYLDGPAGKQYNTDRQACEAELRDRAA